MRARQLHALLVTSVLLALVAGVPFAARGEDPASPADALPPLVAPRGTAANPSQQNPFSQAGQQVMDIGARAGIDTQKDLETVVGRLIQGALALVGVLFFGYMVWAGYLWMTAHGESDQITKAKDMIKNGTIGLIITFGAYALTSFVIAKLLSTGAVVR